MSACCNNSQKIIFLHYNKLILQNHVLTSINFSYIMLAYKKENVYMLALVIVMGILIGALSIFAVGYIVYFISESKKPIFRDPGIKIERIYPAQKESKTEKEFFGKEISKDLKKAMLEQRENHIQNNKSENTLKNSNEEKDNYEM